MATPAKTPLEELYQRPGFMIRRVHQIAVSLFMEETGKLGVTNRQYGILFVLRDQPGIDQISVANLLGLDRSTTGMVLKKLEADGLVARSAVARDRRRHSLQLTRSGQACYDSSPNRQGAPVRVFCQPLRHASRSFFFSYSTSLFVCSTNPRAFLLIRIDPAKRSRARLCILALVAVRALPSARAANYRQIWYRVA